MITKEITYKKAFEIKKQSLNEKIKRREMLLESATSSDKRILEIDTQLSLLGANLALTVLSGDTKTVADIKAITERLNAEKDAILKKYKVADIVYDCPLCKDSGYVGGKVCDCVKKLANSIAIKEFNDVMPINECKFENFDLKYYSDKNENHRRRMTSILNLCKDYVDTFDPKTSQNLLFLGEPGLGKTHLTLAIVSGVIEKGYLPVYGPADNLFSAIEKEKFQGENKGVYEQMQTCDLLVIDDLGTEMVTSFTRSVLYNLINTRLLAKRPTIINTNLSMKEIEELYSPRITSRIIGNYNANKFVGFDIRQQKILGK